MQRTSLIPELPSGELDTSLDHISGHETVIWKLKVSEAMSSPVLELRHIFKADGVKFRLLRDGIAPASDLGGAMSKPCPHRLRLYPAPVEPAF